MTLRLPGEVWSRTDAATATIFQVPSVPNSFLGSRSPAHDAAGSPKERHMPDTAAKRRATRDRKQGKSPSTQAGEFVREEMHEKKEGKGNAKNRKQAIAIGLSNARRAGVNVPDKRKTSKKKKTSGRSRSTTSSGGTKRTTSRKRRSSPTKRTGGRRTRASR
jgi:hypothetical protein